ncbi:Transcriptional activator CadC (plasmid) [Pseudoalteromonas sp. THAF3]|uniref:winged helix-turn-helix domain-containing protein n=1 Tax=Pseudoalteromonas sp. THAF3 TaxID=2587843 RepID=UPI0012678C09|nr:transcriptional regulator [Pseudoalteromonas sp. THAF3]QFU06365.1 Transcriptional activator CadC [Pseudoalteromonas sp. THAF3]
MANQSCYIDDTLVDFAAMRVRRQGRWYPLEAKQSALLRVLAERPGEAVSREYILNAVWGDVVVSDNSLSQLVTQLRKKLADDKGQPRFIRTVPRIGYQLIAEVTPVTIQRSAFNKRLPWLGVAALTLSLVILMWVWPKGSSVQHFSEQYRASSAPGGETHLTLSHHGRYLAYSQRAENRRHFDLMIYDTHSHAHHSIRTSGYSEQALAFSKDGHWLLYERLDAFGCDLRLLPTSQPVELWRLAKDISLGHCQQRVGGSPVFWPSADTVWLFEWHQGEIALVTYRLQLQARAHLTQRQVIAQLPSTVAALSQDNQLAYVVSERNQFQVWVRHIDSGSQQQLFTSTHPIQSLTWSENGLWVGAQKLHLVTLDGGKQSFGNTAALGQDLSVSHSEAGTRVVHNEGSFGVNLFAATWRSPGKLHSAQLSSSTRLDVLPTLSGNGEQLAYASYAKAGDPRNLPVEIWQKRQQQSSPSLLASFPANTRIKSMRYSHEGDYLLIHNVDNSLYLLHVFSRTLVQIVDPQYGLKMAQFSANDKHIQYHIRDDENVPWKVWQYDLDSRVASPSSDKLAPQNEPLAVWQARISAFIPSDVIADSMRIYRPAIFNGGIYYVIRQGHQLSLYRYTHNPRQNTYIGELGFYGYGADVSLSLATSSDGSRLVYNQVTDFEYDIVINTL